MSLGHGASVVRNGLILQLDPGNPKSYPGSGSTWKDLTGNGNFTLFGGYSYNSANNGYINFDGTAGTYAGDSNQARTNFGSGSFTIQMWINPTSATSIDSATYGRICEKAGFPTAYFTIHMINSNKSIQFTIRDDSVFDISTSSATNSITLGQWCMVTCSVDRANAVSNVYVNTTKTTTALSTFGAMTMASKPFLIPSNFAEPNCKIGEVKVYNTALSDTSVLKNFSAHRGRYGI